MILLKVTVKKLSHQGEFAIAWKLMEAMEKSTVQCLQYAHWYNKYIKNYIS